MPLFVKIIAFFLATVLIISGMAFIISSEISQYRLSLEERGTATAISTRNAYLGAKQTDDALNTVQANINATATALVNATATGSNGTATRSALGDLYTQSTHGDPIFDDALTDDTGSGHWDQGNTSPNTGCVFENGYYFVREAGQGKFQPCIAQATNFSDFAYQVDLTIMRGNQGQAGLVFRADDDITSFYFFHIDTNGFYALDLYEKSGSASNLLQGVSSAVSIGLGQSNQVAVLARKDTIYLYANGQYLASVANSTLGAGKIGVGVVDKSTPVEVQFANAQLWSSPSANDTQATPTTEP
jgi:hypothetical protein